jgi:hypothetical protein
MPPLPRALRAAVLLADVLAPPWLEAQASPSLRNRRAALDLRGREGPLDLHLNAGVHYIVNADHQEGRTVNRFEGRLMATLGMSRRGVLR